MSKEVTKTYPAQKNGDIRQIITGRLIVRRTNLDTGKSIVVNASGPVKLTIHPDGSLTGVLTGPSVITFFPTDVPAGPATYLNKGREVLTLTTSGQTILVSRHGHQRDLCAALS